MKKITEKQSSFKEQARLLDELQTINDSVFNLEDIIVKNKPDGYLGFDKIPFFEIKMDKKGVGLLIEALNVLRRKLIKDIEPDVAKAIGGSNLISRGIPEKNHEPETIETPESWAKKVLDTAEKLKNVKKVSTPRLNPREIDEKYRKMLAENKRDRESKDQTDKKLSVFPFGAYWYKVTHEAPFNRVDMSVPIINNPIRDYIGNLLELIPQDKWPDTIQLGLDDEGEITLLWAGLRLSVAIIYCKGLGYGVHINDNGSIYHTCYHPGNDLSFESAIIQRINNSEYFKKLEERARKKTEEPEYKNLDEELNAYFAKDKNLNIVIDRQNGNNR